MPAARSRVRFARGVGVLVVVAGVAGLMGCADPGSVVGFEEKDPAARIRAIRQASANKDATAIPSLIELLESDDPAERLLAIGALERITGETRGFEHAAPIDERRAAVERWAAWYAGRSGGSGGGVRGSTLPLPASDERRTSGS